jgi:tRNA(Ile)-lysidine synthase
VDVAARAHGNRQSIEEAGRDARYEFLAGVARQEHAPVIAVGHNQDDQIETILMHFLRGSGPAGLRGMKPASSLPGHPGLWLVRPLLGVDRAEIERYCATYELDPILDESNADPGFFRNRLRVELLPELESYNPQVRRRILDMGDIMAAEEELLADLTDDAWRDALLAQEESYVAIGRATWLAQAPAIRRRMLRRAAAAVLPGLRDLSFRALESARATAEAGHTGTRANLPGGLTLLVSYDALIVYARSSDMTVGFPQLQDSETHVLPNPGTMALAGGWRLSAEWIEADTISIDTIRNNSDLWTVYVSCEANCRLFVRPRRKGEKMWPLGMNSEKKLKEIMIDRKIPAYLRDLWPIVVTETHPIWLVGHVLDHRAAVEDGRQRLVRLRCLPPVGLDAS